MYRRAICKSLRSFVCAETDRLHGFDPFASHRFFDVGHPEEAGSPTTAVSTLMLRQLKEARKPHEAGNVPATPETHAAVADLAAAWVDMADPAQRFHQLAPAWKVLLHLSDNHGFIGPAQLTVFHDDTAPHDRGNDVGGTRIPDN